jgi:uncharacterized membrane protein YeaQ/YmgE (transglycosylase-associated protein family)
MALSRGLEEIVVGIIGLFLLVTIISTLTSKLEFNSFLNVTFFNLIIGVMIIAIFAKFIDLFKRFF